MIFQKQYVVWLSVLVMSVMTSLVFWQQVDTFNIQVSPLPANINEPLTLTVTSIDENGDTVTTYDSLMQLTIQKEGVRVDRDAEIVKMPWWWVLEITEEDLGQKTYSNGLTFYEQWVYTLYVEDFLNEDILGTQSITIGSDPSDNDEDILIEIQSPTSGEIVQTSDISLNVQSDGARVPYQIFLDGQKLDQEGETDEDGNIVTFINDIEPWERRIYVRLQWPNNDILGESEEITFSYEPAAFDDTFKWLTMSPEQPKVWDKVLFQVKVGDGVTSVQMRLGNIGTFPLDKVNTDTYAKEVLMETAWTFPLDVQMVLSNGERKTYNEQATVVVQQNVSLTNVRVVKDPLSTTEVSLSREHSWSPNSFEVRYGTSQNNLSMTQSVTQPNITIGSLESGQTYFFQVQAKDNAGQDLWDPSQVQSIQMVQTDGQQQAASCSVVGIDWTTQKIGEQYFLTWQPVPWAVSYNVYRAEFATDDLNQMQKVGETSTTRFAYPFNPYAGQAQYATYAVQAVCQDGQTQRLGGIRSVQVGPEHNIMVVLLLIGLVYAWYRLYAYTE